MFFHCVLKTAQDILVLSHALEGQSVCITSQLQNFNERLLGSPPLWPLFSSSSPRFMKHLKHPGILFKYFSF